MLGKTKSSLIKPWLLLCIALPLTLAMLFSILEALTDQDKTSGIAEAIALFPFGYLFNDFLFFTTGIFSLILIWTLNILFWYVILIYLTPPGFMKFNFKSVFLNMMIGLLIFCLGYLLYGIITAEISDRIG